MEGLADGVIPPDRATFAMLQQEIMRLVHLVEDLGQLARAEAARAYLDRRDLDLAEAIGQMLALYSPNFEAKGIVVTTRFAAGAERVRADRDKLLQAVRNLVDNAWKYTPDGGSVSVSAERTAAGVRICFANSGSGISEADLPFIFERFFP